MAKNPLPGFFTDSLEASIKLHSLPRSLFRGRFQASFLQPSIYRAITKSLPRELEILRSLYASPISRIFFPAAATLHVFAGHSRVVDKAGFPGL